MLSTKQSFFRNPHRMMIHFFTARLLLYDNLTPHRCSTTSLRRVAASNIRLENIICISDFGTTGAYGFGIIFVLHLKPSPLGDLGFDIDKYYYDAQLRHEIIFWFLKSSLETKTAHFMRFGKNVIPDRRRYLRKTKFLSKKLIKVI